MNGPATFVDGHLRFWDPERFHYRWLRGDRHLERAFLPEHLDAEPAGIVVVQAIPRMSSAAPAPSARVAPG
jgi:predicted TIM-barrel fold metal-dependent hydrolase